MTIKMAFLKMNINIAVIIMLGITFVIRGEFQYVQKIIHALMLHDFLDFFKFSFYSSKDLIVVI